MIDPSSFLEVVAQYGERKGANQVQNRPPRIGVVQRVPGENGRLRINLDGDAGFSTDGVAQLDSYHAVDGDRVLLMPAGHTYVALGKVPDANDPNLNRAGLGTIAYHRRTTAPPTTTGITKETGQKIMEVHCTLRAGRSYRVRAPGVAVSATASEFMLVWISYVLGGATAQLTDTALARGDAWISIANAADTVSPESIITPVADTAASFLLSYNGNGPSATFSVFCDATRPLQLYVDDIGIPLDQGIDY